MGYHHEVINIEKEPLGFRVHFYNPDGSEDYICCEWLINCAGLQSDKIAGRAGIDVEQAGYRIYPCKGEYFSLPYHKSRFVSRLIYPPPSKELEGLGIHLTKSLDGRLRLGPNAYYTDKIDYQVDESHVQEFWEAASSFLSFLDIGDLEPEMAGIRPKLQAPGSPFRDFVINHEVERGLRGLINLIGIESPGLTCCLSIARMVGNML